MDIDALHSALVSLTILPEELRETREELRANAGIAPAGLDPFLGSIERDMRLAKAALARELGFPVCQCCWPPELLVTATDGAVSCASGDQRERYRSTGTARNLMPDESRESADLPIPSRTSANAAQLATAV
jgi:hypothetical protein